MKSKNTKVRASRNKAKAIEKPPPLKMLPPQQANCRQALQFIDSIVALAPVGRREHVQAQKALQQLGGAINELEQLKKG